MRIVTMKKIKLTFFFFLVLSSSYYFSQNRTNNWVLHKNGLLDFNSEPPVFSYSANFETFESSSTISDKNGNLLFYTNGDSILGSNDLILQNGLNLTINSGSSVVSTTQGSLIIPFLNSDSLYYEFTNDRPYTLLGHSYLTYSIIDKSLNSGIGGVISKQNIISIDTLSEKMVITKHCNGNYYWLVVIKYDKKIDIYDGAMTFNKCVFQSFLIDDTGVRNFPVQSFFDFAPPLLGQMKFNIEGTKLAYAAEKAVYVFDFDASTGKVSLNKKINVQLENGYGLEWSPNSQFIYVNEKQIEVSTGIVFSLQKPNGTQLQLAKNGKIYGFQRSVNEFYSSGNFQFYEYFDNDWLIIGNHQFRMFEISNPNGFQTTCSLDTNFIDIVYPFFYSTISIALPNLPHFLIFEDSLDFKYDGYCLSDTFNFQLTNTNGIDSVFWEFPDLNQTSTNLTPSVQFSNSGTSEVICTIYTNGIPHIIKKCVTIIGENTDVFDNQIEMCLGESFSYTATEYISTDYLWSTGDTTANLVITEPGTYSLQASNICGVFDDIINVELANCESEIIIPNVITLNSDYTNDVFSVKVKNMINIQCRIVNRWGETIHLSSLTVTPTNQQLWDEVPLWDGKSNGEKVLEGVYFYLIEAENTRNEWSSFHGNVSVFN